VKRSATASNSQSRNASDPGELESKDDESNVLALEGDDVVDVDDDVDNDATAPRGNDNDNDGNDIVLEIKEE